MSNRLSFCLPFAVIALAIAAMAPNAAEAQVRVNIESIPPGATVYVDSVDSAPLGTTPMSRVRAPSGSHTLIFRLAGHRDARLPVTVRRWGETFRATLQPFGRVVVTAGNASAQGATVTIDGQPVGSVPFEHNVEPGRHLVVVQQEGFVSYQQWLDVAGGQVLTIPVLLERSAPNVGSLLVASDVAGARVTVDGTPRGTTPIVVDDLAEGDHQVEVTADGEGLAPHRETIRVRAGERVTVRATLRLAASTGIVRVISNAPNAVISIDGEVIGSAPVTASDLTVGEHIVQATAPDYEPGAQTVVVEAGRQRVVNMQLVAAERRPGRLVVNADVAGARIFVDGRDVGAPPAIVEEASAGTHAVIIRAPGYEEYRATCAVVPDQDCVVDAVLESKGTPVRVEANVANAELYFDGDLVGPVPWEGMLPIGSHHFEIRAEGYRSHGEQIALRLSSQTRVFNAHLVGEDELTPAEERSLERERQRNIHQAVSHSATVLPEDLALMDISVGYPYLGELRLGVGLHRLIEAGIAFRSFGVLNEFELRLKSGYRLVPYFSVGGQMRLGGGLGPSRDQDVGGLTVEHPTNSFFFSLEAMATLHFAQAGAFTFFMALDTHSDRWDWSGSDRDVVVADSRQGVARGRFGGALEFTLSKRLNIWGIFEGTVGKDRRILGDIFGADGITGNDPNMYGRLGVTLKFGTIWEEEEIEAGDDVPLQSGMSSSGGAYDSAEEPPAEYEEAPAPAPAAEPAAEPTAP